MAKLLKEKGLLLSAAFMVLFLMGLMFVNPVLSQTQRNPVLEFCSGTW